VKRKGAQIFWLDEVAIGSGEPVQRARGRNCGKTVVTTSGQRQAISDMSGRTNRGASGITSTAGY